MHPTGQSLRQPLCTRERYGGLGLLLGRMGLSAVAMDIGNIEQHSRQAGGMGQLLGALST
jgi:hypothetical protein